MLADSRWAQTTRNSVCSRPLFRPLVELRCPNKQTPQTVSTHMSESAAPSDRQQISAYFDAMRQEREQLSADMTASFAELDSLREQLQRHRDQLDEERTDVQQERQSLEAARELHEQDLDTQQQEQAKRLQTVEAELAAARKEVSTANKSAVNITSALEAELAEAQQSFAESEAAAAATGEAVEQRLQELAADRDQFERDLTGSQTRVAQLEKSLETLARAQDALATLDDTTSDAQNNSTSPEDLEFAFQEVALHKQQVSQLQTERDSLEQELDTVRVRACQLSDTVNLTKRQMTEQQAQWATELTNMRQVLEQQAETINAGRAAAPVEHATSNASVPSTPVADVGRTGDQVVGNVMAQFDKLRQQRVKRSEERCVETPLQHDCG